MSSTPTGGREYTEQNLNTFLDRVLSTADTTVFRQLDLDMHHTARYDQSRLLDLLAHCGVSGEFANGGARTRRVEAGDRSMLRSDRRSPDAKALGRQLRQLDRDGIGEQFADAFDAFHGLTRRARLFERPVDVAVEAYTTMECPSCGERDATERTGDVFRCPCGYAGHADLSASRTFLEQRTENGEVRSMARPVCLAWDDHVWSELPHAPASPSEERTDRSTGDGNLAAVG